MADPQSLNKTKYVCKVLCGERQMAWGCREVALLLRDGLLWRRELNAKLPSDVTLTVTSDNLPLVEATGDQMKMPIKK